MKISCRPLVIICLLAPILTGCSGAALIETSSSENNETKTLNVVVLHRTSDENGDAVETAVANGTKTFLNDIGITISLEKSYVSWGHLFLISGGEDEECEAGHDVELHLEKIESMLDADLTETELAVEDIEDRAYCDYALEITPDNADTEGVNEAPEIAGRSVYVAGSWNDGTWSGSFEIAVEEEIRVEAAFQALEDGEVITHPLHFHDDEDAASVTFENIYDAWLNGMTFTESAEEAAALLKTNVANALGQRIEEDE